MSEDPQGKDQLPPIEVVDGDAASTAASTPPAESFDGAQEPSFDGAQEPSGDPSSPAEPVRSISTGLNMNFATNRVEATAGAGSEATGPNATPEEHREPATDDAATTGPIDIGALPTSSTAAGDPAGIFAIPEEHRPSTRVFTDDDFEAIEAAAAPQAYSEQVPVVRTSPRGNRPRRPWRIAALSAVAVLLLAVIAGVGSELYVRHKVTSCLQTAFTDLTGTSTTVSVPRGPLLVAWMNGNVDWVQVDTNDSPNGSAMRLHARATDISRDGRSVQRLQGDAFVPYERVRELTGEQAGGAAQIESITGDEKSGTITIESNYRVVFLSVPATVVLKPTVTGGKVDFAVQEAKAFGIGLPGDFAQQLVDQVAQGMLGPLFDEIKVEQLKVTDNGVQFAFSGDNLNMQAASTGSNLSGTTCT